MRVQSLRLPVDTGPRCLSGLSVTPLLTQPGAKGVTVGEPGASATRELGVIDFKQLVCFHHPWRWAVETLEIRESIGRGAKD